MIPVEGTNYFHEKDTHYAFSAHCSNEHHIPSRKQLR